MIYRLSKSILFLVSVLIGLLLLSSSTYSNNAHESDACGLAFPSLYDPERLGSALLIGQIDLASARDVCEAGLDRYPRNARINASVAHLEVLKQEGADFERAYRLAQIATDAKTAYGYAVLGIIQTTPNHDNFDRHQGTHSLIAAMEMGSEGAYLDIARLLTSAEYYGDIDWEVLGGWIEQGHKKYETKALALSGVCHAYGVFCDLRPLQAAKMLSLSAGRGDKISQFFNLMNLANNHADLKQEEDIFVRFWNAVGYLDKKSGESSDWVDYLFIVALSKILVESENYSVVEFDRILFRIREWLFRETYAGNHDAAVLLITATYCGAGFQKSPEKAVFIINELGGNSPINVTGLLDVNCENLFGGG